MSDRVLVYLRAIKGGTWHIAAYEPTGYGAWSLCGRSFHESNIWKSRESVAADVLCKSCQRVEAAR